MQTAANAMAVLIHASRNESCNTIRVVSHILLLQSVGALHGQITMPLLEHLSSAWMHLPVQKHQEADVEQAHPRQPAMPGPTWQ